MHEGKTIKVGIIGCGKIAQVRHIPEYMAHPCAHLIGFYDANHRRSQELAAQFGGRAYASAEEMLADQEIAAVSICLPNFLHADFSVAALRAGKHVLCEKPMAVSIEEGEKMVREAERAQRWLMIGQNQRVTPTHAKAKALLKEGVIGQVLTFKTCFGHGGPEAWSVDAGTNNWFFNKQKSAMGAIGDLGVHKTDLIQYLLDSQVAEVRALVTTLDKRKADGQLVDVDDNAFCIYRMRNGTVGTLTASWSYYGEEDNSTVLYGTKGIMKLYANPDRSIEICLSDGNKKFYDTDLIQTNAHQTKSGIIDLFIGALIRNEEPPISGREVLHAMRAVFAAMESSQRGCPVLI